MYVSSDLKIRVTELTEISKEKTYRFNVCLSNELGSALHQETRNTGAHVP